MEILASIFEASWWTVALMGFILMLSDYPENTRIRSDNHDQR